MNIVLLSTGMMKSGKEATSITINDFAKELTKTNHKVVIIAEKRGEKNRKEIKGNIVNYKIRGFKYLGFYNRVLGHALGVKKMQKSMNFKFNVIHNFSASPLFVLRGFLSKMFAKKAIFIHTMKSYSRNKWGSSFHFILNLADIITVPTKVFAQKLKKAGVKKNKIKIINSNINTNKFKPLNKEELKIKYGHKNKKIIFYYGAMWHMKGVNYLIKAIPQIIQKRKDIKVIFAPRNNDNHVKNYRKMMSEKNNKVEIITKDIDIVEYVNMADIVVLPYPSLIGTEGNPSCMLEAMACKTPVVTTDLPELREIADGCVFMAKPGDVQSLQETMIHALNHPNPEMVERAYQKAQEFSVEKITNQFTELYEELLKDKKK